MSQLHLASPPRVLIVDDEPAIADTLLYVLRAEGFAAEHVLLGGEALQRHASQAFDLWLLDIGLPDMTGFDVLRRLRASSGAAAQVPVIFLTARSEEIDRILGLELGADDYVAKPFSPREVAARVRAILRRGRLLSEAVADAGAETVAETAVWQRDADALTILFHGRRLDLTRYEYRLLDLLLEQPGKVYRRESIMDRVWADAPESSDRTIDAHVKTLRAKLRAVRPDDDSIQTHRGIGYAIKP